MQWTRTLSRWLAASVAGLLSVSLVFALVGVKPWDNSPAPVDSPLSAQATGTVPLFATTEPAENQSVLVLQTDDLHVHGWVAGKKSFAGETVNINGASVTVREDNTFAWEPRTRTQVKVVASLSRPGQSPLTAQTTLIPTAAPDGSTIFFVTDRSAYRPGHTLKFVAFLRRLLPSGEFEPVRVSDISVNLTSVAKHTRAARLKLTSDDRGRATGEYTFSDADALDQYILTAEGFSGSGMVMLGEYRKSKVALKLKGEVKDGKLSVAFDARDYRDRPVKGTAASYTATVTRTVEPEKLTLNPDEFAKPESGPPTVDEFDALPDD
ncbi:MAG TPA: hypothetical protein VG122_14460, partial [Gemmata sp.]|nr:hypothetical protein [Gemmata sp.]